MSLNKAICIQDSLDNKPTKWSTRRVLLCAQSQLKNIRLRSKCMKVISHIKKFVTNDFANKCLKWSTIRVLLCAQSQLKNIRLGLKCLRVISHKVCIKKVVTDDLADILHFIQN